MTDGLDLDAYFNRIGYGGPATATLETLCALHRLHPAAIPFENLDSRFGVTPALDLASLQAKLVGRRRGGYCFEQNTLFAAVLEALGYPVVRLIARVRWGLEPQAAPTARSHKLLRVEAEGEDLLVDVGFGSGTLTGPLRMASREPQLTPDGEARLVDRDGEIEQQLHLGDDWRPAYRFTLQPAPFIDFEVANWHVATHPQSRFVGNLIAARAEPGRRLTLLNRDFSLRWADGRVEQRRLDEDDALRAVLVQAFGIDPPDGADLSNVA